MADATAAAGSTYETVGVEPGQMTWISANAWASSLTVSGFTDWRLPTTADPDPTCTDDIAGTVPSADPVAFNCTGSEMGHLFYIGFGATTDTVVFVTGDPTELAKFTNVLNGDFWSGTSFPVDLANPNSAYSFNFSHGTQGGGPKTDSAYAWAVRSGDVSAVPVPGAIWLS